MIFKTYIMQNFKGKIKLNLQWIFQTLGLDMWYTCNLCFCQSTALTEILFSY